MVSLARARDRQTMGIGSESLSSEPVFRTSLTAGIICLLWDPLWKLGLGNHYRDANPMTATAAGC